MAGRLSKLRWLVPGVKNRRGDTIVEVLIATAVISLVLVGAYAVTNRNRTALQDTQEQSIALKLVERQVEILRGAPATSLPPDGGCFDISGSPQPAGNNCIQKADGAVAVAAYGGAKYTMSVNLTADVYTVSATWDTLSGSTSTVSSYYRRAL